MTTFWFIVIAVLWTGFMVLEGFDFGVGVLHGVVGPRRRRAARGDDTRSAPVWDGNEVWLIIAGAAMFAAFPGWYATMFSGLYPALVLLLVALILRGVAIEFRDKRDSVRWRGGWSIVLIASSLVVPLLIGVALADFALRPADRREPGVRRRLLRTCCRSTRSSSGSTFVADHPRCTGPCSSASRLHGEPHDRAARAGPARWPRSPAVLVLAMVIWTHVDRRGRRPAQRGRGGRAGGGAGRRLVGDGQPLGVGLRRHHGHHRRAWC